MLKRKFRNIKNILLCDNSNMSYKGTPKSKLLDRDGYHLNEEGVTILASNIRQSIEKLCLWLRFPWLLLRPLLEYLRSLWFVLGVLFPLEVVSFTGCVCCSSRPHNFSIDCLMFEANIVTPSSFRWYAQENNKDMYRNSFLLFILHLNQLM
jgi:hypothetical protein